MELTLFTLEEMMAFLAKSKDQGYGIQASEFGLQNQKIGNQEKIGNPESGFLKPVACSL
jgi:hypothetical protein